MGGDGAGVLGFLGGSWRLSWGCAAERARLVLGGEASCLRRFGGLAVMVLRIVVLVIFFLVFFSVYFFFCWRSVGRIPFGWIEWICDVVGGSWVCWIESVW